MSFYVIGKDASQGHKPAMLMANRPFESAFMAKEYAKTIHASYEPEVAVSLKLIERDTGAKVTKTMVEQVVKDLASSEPLDPHGAEFRLYNPVLADAINLLEQLAAHME